MDILDRARGAMLGLAVGDALGTTLEFAPPGTFSPISEIVGGGPFGLQPGESKVTYHLVLLWFFVRLQ